MNQENVSSFRIVDQPNVTRAFLHNCLGLTSESPPVQICDSLKCAPIALNSPFRIPPPPNLYHIQTDPVTHSHVFVSKVVNPPYIISSPTGWRES